MSVDWAWLENYTASGAGAPPAPPLLSAARVQVSRQNLSARQQGLALRQSGMSLATNRQAVAQRRLAIQQGIAQQRMGQQAYLAQQRLSAQQTQANQRTALGQQRLAQQGALGQQRLTIQQQRLAMAQQPDEQPVDARGKKLARGLTLLAGSRERVANMPTPGGVGMLVLILVLLLFFIVPVNGRLTRARLLFDVGRGAARLPLPSDPQTHPPASFTGSGGEDGTDAPPTVVNPTLPPSAFVETTSVSPFLADYSPNGIPMPGVQIAG